MSEAQKSAMGPRRLFILLALGAVVFYFLSSGDEVEGPEENISNTEAVEDLDLGDDSTTLTFEEETANPANNTKKPLPQTSAENDEYSPQSTGNSDEHSPQSSGNNDGYTPQSAQ